MTAADTDQIQAETERVARAWFGALDTGDVDGAIGLLDENVEWQNLVPVEGVSDVVPWFTPIRHGVPEVAETFRIRGEVVDIHEFKPLSMLVQGDQAVGTIRDRATVLSTGKEFVIEFVSWMQVKNGKIVKWRAYTDPSPVIVAFRPEIESSKGGQVARNIDRALSSELIQAVGANDVTLTTSLLRRGADPNARASGTGLTVLMMAACQANVDLVKLLLDAGADLLTTDSQTGATPLHKACQGGSAEIARLLLDRGAFVDAVTPTMGHTPIMDALWYKWPEVVDVLLEYGANVHLDTHYGFTLFDHLNFELNVNDIGKEKIEAIDRAIKARIAQEEKEMASQRVMAALREGKADEARQQIAAGEPVNTLYPHVNSFFDGHTPLLVAARDGHADAVKDLLAAGADVHPVDWTFKGSPIHKATYNGRPDILRMLMDAPGIDLDVQGPINGYSPLHDALWHGYTECARMLIDGGARLDTKGHDGKLPVDVAADVYGADSEMVQYLRSKTGG